MHHQPRNLPRNPRNPRNPQNLQVLWLALALVSAACSGPTSAASAPDSAPPGEIRVEPRDLVRTIRVTGTTEAKQSLLVLAPALRGAVRGNLVITKMAPPARR